MQQDAHPLARSDPARDEMGELVGALVELAVGQPLGSALQRDRIGYGVTARLEVPVQALLPLSGNGTNIINSVKRPNGRAGHKRKLLAVPIVNQKCHRSVMKVN